MEREEPSRLLPDPPAADGGGGVSVSEISTLFPATPSFSFYDAGSLLVLRTGTLKVGVFYFI